MNDFETRLADSLRAGAEGAPAGGGLAAAARGRARRRRTSAIAGVAVAVLAVVAIPVGIATMSGGDRGTVPTPPANSTDPTSEPTPVPASWRVESWRDVELQVPDDWGYGSRRTWCLEGRGGLEAPVVERPGQVVRLIDCGEPSDGYGVTFGDSAAVDLARESGDVWQYGWESPDQIKMYPRDAWLSIVVTGDVAVSVATPEREMTQRIVDSLHAIDGVDANGCPPRIPLMVARADDGMSVCRYSANRWLEQSELLSARDAETALAALEAAPTRTQARSCGFDPEHSEGTDFFSQAGRVRVVWANDGCAAGNGVFFNGRVAELTEDVMYWALSPGWSGSVSSGVPLPDRLRR